MSKRIILILLSLCMLVMAGCGEKPGALSVEGGDEPGNESSTEPLVNSEPIINPLTGMADITSGKENDRPVAIMVNNIVEAQAVQTGIGKADIVYETEVEGGITRLMGVYQDVSKVEKIGTVRSARYAYVDLAMGHNAIYVHHGQDPKYCAAHLKDTDDFTVSENNYGVRISNGLAAEHTLYAYGDKLWSGLVSEGYKTEKANSDSWQKFADPAAPVTFGTPANAVNIPFSNAYKSTFKYDSATSKYVRYFNGKLRQDYNTKESTSVKNLFVLMTTITNYSDNYHKQITLSSGDGYYFVNGTYTQIKWSKGSASSGFKFTNADGTELTVNPGNSWVCIANKSTSKPIIE